MQLYSTKASRNLIRAEAEMLRHAEPIKVLGSFGMQKPQPLNKTDTVVFRRVLPFGAAALANPATGYSETPVITPSSFVTAEGATPTPQTISYTDVTVTLEQYSLLFKFSNKVELMYEDDIPADMKEQTGQTLAEVCELVAYGGARAGTGVIYTNGTTRVGLNTKITLGKLRQAARALEKNRGMKVTSVIKPGLNFGTSPVEEAYPVFIHTDLENDVRELPGFIKRVEYGSAMTPIHAREIGSVENFRFVTSPLLAPYLAGGAAVGGTGMESVGAANCDVYPMLIMAKDAWGHVALQGYGHTSITPTLISSKVRNHANPSGKFGYCGAEFWYAFVRLNENFMLRVETCASAL